MDLLLFLIFMIISMFSIFFVHKLFDKEGLLFLMILMVGINIVSSFKIISLGIFNLNLNIISYISIISIYYIILEKYGKKDKYNFIKALIFSSLFISIMLILGSIYESSVDDVIGINIRMLFLGNYRILIATVVTVILDIVVTESVYNFIKPIGSTDRIDRCLTSALIMVIDSVIFSVVSYMGVLQINAISELLFINYLARVLVMIIYSPLVEYIIKSKKVDV